MGVRILKIPCRECGATVMYVVSCNGDCGEFEVENEGALIEDDVWN